MHIFLREDHVRRDDRDGLRERRCYCKREKSQAFLSGENKSNRG